MPAALHTTLPYLFCVSLYHQYFMLSLLWHTGISWVLYPPTFLFIVVPCALLQSSKLAAGMQTEHLQNFYHSFTDMCDHQRPPLPNTNYHHLPSTLVPVSQLLCMYNIMPFEFVMDI